MRTLVTASVFVVALIVAGTTAVPGVTKKTSSTFAPLSKPPAVPGALPLGFKYRYAEPGTGWPVSPRATQHPVRGSFLDPRGPDNDGLAGYHFGVDINVDDNRPDRGAPSGLSHRVFALESGIAQFPVKDRARSCGNRRLDLGHFAYWHVSPNVKRGQKVRAGQQIGWTCAGEWHVHISEWQRWQGTRVWVNPLHPGGKLQPYTSTDRPLVSALTFHSPPTRPWAPRTELSVADTSKLLPATQLRGLVELRARVSVPQSFLGFLATQPRLRTSHHPYRLAVEVRSMATGKAVLRRVTFRSDSLPLTPYLVHYAPGTAQNASVMECLGAPPTQSCDGSYLFRPFSRYNQEFWDTRRSPNGRYRITVTAWSLTGTSGTATIDVSVAN